MSGSVNVQWSFALLLLLAPVAVGAGPGDDRWSEILAATVNGAGEVAYRSLAGQGQGRLAEALRGFGTVDPVRLDRDGAVAFWVNAYNALVLSAVANGESPETVATRARMFHWFGATIGGSRRTLDEISVILDRFARADPRIHFALCNGTRGGPTLAGVPYTADGLYAELEDAARRFVRDPTKNRFDAFAGDIELSRLFEWYRPDFESEGGSLAGYVRRLVAGPGLAWFLAQAVEVRFRRFDWTLNAAPGERPR